MQRDGKCVIIGGGPAGLTAAWELKKAGMAASVFEKDDMVGGISRTVNYNGYRFDIGGHRFFTKVKMVEDWWQDMMADDFLTRPRLSRIYYEDKYFDYPLKPANALLGLGLVEAFRIGFSYLKAQLFPVRKVQNLEEWVSNRFGFRLYSIFFKTYTEKVWGIPCTEISADWAAQRIKNLNLLSAVKNAFFKPRSDSGVITTLIEQFQYPRLGPGMMWERVTERLKEHGYPVNMGWNVVAIHHEGGKVVAVTVQDQSGTRKREEGTDFISSMPIRELIHALDPAPPPEVLQAADKLNYRDFLTVGLILDTPDPFPDNWIYIHSPEVKVGRIQNFKAWSPFMVPNENHSCIGLEYFVQENDDVWSARDEDLIDLGKRECERLGLIKQTDVVDGTVIRMPKAYPVYDQVYQQALTELREYLAALPNLQLVGRNGQHRYNNQDHSMVTAIYAAENICGASHDIWDVNVEDEYHEEVKEGDQSTHAQRGGDRLVPQRVELDRISIALREAFARYDAVALGGAVGILMGFGLFFATAILLMQGGVGVGWTLSVLGNFLPGFSVTWPGALLGLVEAGGFGFAFGWMLARTINGTIALHERALIRRLEVRAALDAVDQEAM